MLNHINQDHIQSISFPLRETLIQIAGLGIDYKNDPNQIHKYFTIPVLIDLLNKYPDEGFRVRELSCLVDGWDVIATNYIASGEELAIALWKAVAYTYNEEERKRQLEANKNWKPDDNQLVTVKHYR